MNDAKNTCIELFNNSVVLDVASRILHDHRCGIRCAGRNTQMASWQKPTSSRLIEQGSVVYRRDLTRYGSTTYSDNYDKGIYTCLVDNTYKLHIGIYNSDPGSYKTLISFVIFNACTHCRWTKSDADGE